MNFQDGQKEVFFRLQFHDIGLASSPWDYLVTQHADGRLDFEGTCL
jgi:hypothetical protein